MTNHLAKRIDEMADQLRASNNEAKLRAEARFTRDLEEYILNGNRLYLFGGVVNLLTTIASICEEQSQLEGDDWAKAATLIDDCASACDMKYEAKE